MEQLKSTSSLSIDTIFSWISNEHSIECKCRLRIFNLSLGLFLVIISATPDYPGASFTQSLRQVIHQVSYSFNLPLNKTMWIEHYPAFNSSDIDYYYHLLLARHQVSWHQIELAKLKFILKQAS